MEKTYKFKKGTETLIINIVLKEGKNLSITGSRKDRYNSLDVCGAIRFHELNPDDYKAPILIEELFDKKFIFNLSKYHLNDIKSGTPEQMALLEAKFGNLNSSLYDEHCEYLKTVGKFEIPAEEANKFRRNPSDKPFEYGSERLFHPLPEDVLSKVKELLT